MIRTAPLVATPADIAAFIAKWRVSTLKERSAAQEHFIDLCRLLGVKTPAEEDPHGEWFTFEIRAVSLNAYSTPQRPHPEIGDVLEAADRPLE